VDATNATTKGTKSTTLEFASLTPLDFFVIFVSFVVRCQAATAPLNAAMGKGVPGKPFRGSGEVGRVDNGESIVATP